IRARAGARFAYPVRTEAATRPAEGISLLGSTNNPPTSDWQASRGKQADLGRREGKRTAPGPSEDGIRRGSDRRTAPQTFRRRKCTSHSWEPSFLPKPA